MDLWKVFLRWFLFIFVGLPVQAAVLAVYPFIYLYYVLFVRPHVARPNEERLVPLINLKQPGSALVPHCRALEFMDFLDNDDDHNALTHWAFWATEGTGFYGMSRLAVVSKGTLLRRFDPKTRLGQGNDTSGDCLVSWCFAYTQLSSSVRRELIPVLLAVASGYLRNLGLLSTGGQAAGWVSNRCNNFGVNYCPDDFPIGQPAGGPQFYTSSCLFALAAKYGGIKWKVVFWAHWLIMGGWYWALMPFVCSRKNTLGYVRDITMKALYVHADVFGFRWWVSRPMEIISIKDAAYRNELFEAMLGNALLQLPEYVDPWAFQRFNPAIDHSDEQWSDHANVYMYPAIRNLRKLANRIKKGV